MQNPTTSHVLKPSLAMLAPLLITAIRNCLKDASFACRHKTDPRHFTRARKLTFLIVNLFMIQKSLKSLTCHLQELWDKLCSHTQEMLEPATASAWTQAREKLAPSAFIELNRTVLLATFYNYPGAARKWHDHRLLACDGSLLELPMSQELADKFGLVETDNQYGECGIRYPQARASVLFDVINRLCIDALIAPNAQGEITLAQQHIAHLVPGDLTLWDRGYPGFGLFARLAAKKVDFVARCSRASFTTATELFSEARGGMSQQITLKAPSDQRPGLIELGLPLEVTVRFVSVKLSTGEIEVLVTSLLDEVLYPTEVFADVYHLRWGVETFYHTLKSHLEVENFTGKTVHAVEQDFHAMIFVANLEAPLTLSSQEQLTSGDAARKNPSVINHAVALHAIKDRAFELFYSDLPVETLLERLNVAFKGAPTCQRTGRSVPRAKKRNVRRALRHQRQKKKVVF